MTTHEENLRLCLVGPGTAMGEVFRRYWLPVALQEELADVDGAPVRTKVLGEDLVAFRDSAGSIGLLGALCPHRNAPLFFGRNEECGLRCVYHGWKFDTEGQCIDMPSEREPSRFMRAIQARSYPTWEGGGLVWAYMGPEGSMPAKPDYEWLRASEACRVVTKAWESCNYLQALEGGIDTAHSSFLHNNAIGAEPGLRGVDKHPRIDVELTDFGYRYASLREIGEGRLYARVNNFLLPSMNSFGQVIDDNGTRLKLPTITSLFWVPMDDTSTVVYHVCYSAEPGQALPSDYRARHEEQFVIAEADRIPGTYWNIRNRQNDYLIDRDLQRTKTFTGIHGIGVQDYAVQEGMGFISDRTTEHLGSSDAAIRAARRLLLEAADWVEHGKAPKGAAPSDHRLARPADHFISQGDSWRSAVEDDVVAAW